jgi:streptogramin lyase
MRAAPITILRPALALAAALIVASLPASALATPAGQITELTTGLQALNGSFPYGIAAGDDGNVWFADQGNGGGVPKIGRVTPAGTITEFPLPAGSSPQRLAAGPDGSVWFTDTGATKAIGRVTAAGVITEFTALPVGSDPFGIAEGSDGNLWFTDGGKNAIGVITPSGAVSETTNGLNSGSKPLLIAAGPDGAMWFTDTGTTKAIGRVSISTSTITEFALPSSSSPFDITTGPDGNLWFTDQASTTMQIGRITPAGAITDFTAGLQSSNHSFPYDIFAGPDGNVWFTDGGNGPNPPIPSAIGRISPSGVITEWSQGLEGAGGSSSTVLGGTLGPDGNVWFTDQGATHAIGVAGTGAQAPSVRRPSVTGSGEQGTQQVCQGDQWSPWDTLLPSASAFSFDGFAWQRDGSAIAGQAGHSYVPTAADVGHQLTCSVTVTYPLVAVTTGATSDPVTVIAANSGPAGVAGTPGATGAAGATGSTGPAGAAGKVELVTCKTTTRKVHHKTRKQTKCTTKLVSGPVKFTTTKTARATLSRDGRTYASGTASVTARGPTRLVLTARRRLLPGRYALVLTTGTGARRVTTRRTITIV